MNVSETCACGASAMISTTGVAEALTYITTWRTTHICPTRHELSEKLGFDLLSSHKKEPPHA